MKPFTQIVALLRLYLKQDRSHFQLILYDSFLMPAMVAYLGLMLFPNAPERLKWWLAGCIVFGIAQGGLIQVGSAILHDRFLGRLDLLRTTPISKGAYYFTHILMAVSLAVGLQWGAVILIRLIGVAPLGLTALVAGTLISVCTASAIGGLGAIVGLRVADFDHGNMTVTALAVSLALVSPVFYNLHDLPRVLQFVAMASPLTSSATLMRELTSGVALSYGALTLMVLLAVLFNAASYRLLRWQK